MMEALLARTRSKYPVRWCFGCRSGLNSEFTLFPNTYAHGQSHKSHPHSHCHYPLQTIPCNHLKISKLHNNTIHNNKISGVLRHSTTNSNLSRRIFPNIQLHQALLLLNYQALLISQMQQANKTITRRDVVHCLLRINTLQVLHNGCELET